MNFYLLDQAAAPEGGGIMNFVFLGAIILVMYLFMFRPQMKRAKEQKKFRAEMKKGDSVITVGGIHGTIAEVGETNVIMTIESGAKMRVEKTGLLSDPSQMMQK